MLPIKLLILIFLGKGYYMSFIYAHLITSLSNVAKRKLNKKLEVVQIG